MEETVEALRERIESIKEKVNNGEKEKERGVVGRRM